MDWFFGAKPSELTPIVRTDFEQVKCNMGGKHTKQIVIDARVVRVIEKVPTYSYWGGDKPDTALHAIDKDGNDWRYHVGHPYGGWVSSTVDNVWVTFSNDHLDRHSLVRKAYRELESDVCPAPAAGTMLEDAAERAASKGYEYFNFNNWVWSIEDGKPARRLRRYLGSEGYI